MQTQQTHTVGCWSAAWVTRQAHAGLAHASNHLAAPLCCDLQHALHLLRPGYSSQQHQQLCLCSTHCS
jgi:hypothetical protein